MAVVADTAAQPTYRYRIGVDVGGTNTDAALLAYDADAGYRVVASSKAETTADVTAGICRAIRQVLAASQVAPAEILSVNVGTTHFINAVIQRDAAKLLRVAVLRLCGPFGREVAPFADWPRDLRALTEGPVGYLAGGREVDGRPIADVSPDEVLRYARMVQEHHITAVAVVGVFSILDAGSPTQEEHARDLLQTAIPGLDVVCSSDVGGAAPFLERENAAILNASILAFGRRTMGSFEDAFRQLDLAHASLYLTQNDGTVMDLPTARRLPIQTFASGATNSLSGAAFLAGMGGGGTTTTMMTTTTTGHKRRLSPSSAQVIMVDVGGTTSDFAALAPSGFPRQSPATVQVGGVRTAFRLPEIVSIGLGGGSHVHVSPEERVTVGPASVGYRLPALSRCFGGPVLTASDVVVAAASGSLLDRPFGSHPVALPETVVQKARTNMRRQLERGIDDMKASDQDVVLLLVGGGSIIVEGDAIQNVKTCIRPPFYDVANAVGAAISKISGDIDQIVIPGKRKQEDIVAEAKAKAIEAACARGARRDTVDIVEVDCIPLQDAGNGAFRVIVRACGELSWDVAKTVCETASSNGHASAPWSAVEEALPVPAAVPNGMPAAQQAAPTSTHPSVEDHPPDDIRDYRPKVSKKTGEWFISKTDLELIAEGCGVLGTGGGGTTYGTLLQCIDTLERLPSGSMRVIDPRGLDPTSLVGLVAGVGAPTVSNERLGSDHEYADALDMLLRYLQVGRDALAGLASGEIGGANGMVPLVVAAAMGLPVLDGDTIGRAYPKLDMSLPYVYGVERACPAALADPRGTSVLIPDVDNPTRLERLMRSACIELGLSAALATSMRTGSFQHYACQRTVSQAWFIGRAVRTARQQKRSITRALGDAIPGCRPLFAGRVSSVVRRVEGGWTMGTATIKAANDSEASDAAEEGIASTPAGGSSLVLQYQNEYLYAALLQPDGTQQPVCTTPDLITVLDTSGSAVATHEVRYGLMVTVIVMPAHPLWTAPQGLRVADPAAFGLDAVYTPMEEPWQEPLSVIEHFGE